MSARRTRIKAVGSLPARKKSAVAESKAESAVADYCISSTDDEVDLEIAPLRHNVMDQLPIEEIKTENITESADVWFGSLPSSPNKAYPEVPIFKPCKRDNDQDINSDLDVETFSSLKEQKTHVMASAIAPNRFDQQEIPLACKKEKDKEDKFTLFDAIFCNPTTNPLEMNEDTAEEITQLKEENEETLFGELTSPENTAVPQIKLDVDGEVVLDQESLVINQAQSIRINNNRRAIRGQEKVKVRARRSVWRQDEVVRFYRALAAVGTDFTSMTALFPGRTRKMLKDKFKREEKNNEAQIDKALYSTEQYDIQQLMEEFAAERKYAAEEKIRQHQFNLKIKEVQQKVQKARGNVRLSRAAIALDIPKVNKNTMNQSLMDEILSLYEGNVSGEQDPTAMSPQSSAEDYKGETAMSPQWSTEDYKGETAMSPQWSTEDYKGEIAMSSQWSTEDYKGEIAMSSQWSTEDYKGETSTARLVIKSPEKINSMQMDAGTRSLVGMTTYVPSTQRTLTNFFGCPNTITSPKSSGEDSDE
ncbi:transcription factor TFIIIB component B'' homolog isoform X1 [Bicyclus anynana]|uniref:Transcription factor TFIIIB component B'' homolog isoform X1 n=2 Tax=Bicyclus anynana TaxID=110368 RepID=A0A6J1N0G9_BICAN|nr:transcription factor TFIIIB component B'' homolog isoform X1 [Bicyclus anynana]